MNRRQSHELTLVVEGAEQGCPIGDHRRVEGDVAGDAVLARAFWVPRRDVGELDRCFHQATGLDLVLDLDVLRPVDGGDQGDVARLQTADHHDLVHRRRHNRELWIPTGLMSSTSRITCTACRFLRGHTLRVGKPAVVAGCASTVRSVTNRRAAMATSRESLVAPRRCHSDKRTAARSSRCPSQGHIASGTSATRA
jgi:hypothetical protein